VGRIAGAADSRPRPNRVSRQGMQFDRAQPSAARQIDHQELSSSLGQRQREDHSVGPGRHRLDPRAARNVDCPAPPRDILPAMIATSAAKPTMSITPITTTAILSARMRLVNAIRQKIPSQTLTHQALSLSSGRAPRGPVGAWSPLSCGAGEEPRPKCVVAPLSYCGRGCRAERGR